MMGVARTTPRWRSRSFAALLTVATAAVGCSTSSGVDIPEILAASASPSSVATGSSNPVASAPASPTATVAEIAATPTPLPTPTPTPEPPLSTEVLRTSIDRSFAALDDLGLQYSFAVFVEGSGYVDERTPHKQLLPASNQKIMTAIGALELLDPAFRFATHLLLDDDDNVFVVGGGDPTLGQGDILAFAAALNARLVARNGTDGIPAINDVVVDPSYFPDTRLGPGWPERYLPVDVGPMSGLMIDDNQHRGDDAYLADPDLGNAQLIAQLFSQAGIEVRGEARVGSPTSSAVDVARQTSPSTGTMVDIILGRSDNEIAEALVRQIGLENVGVGEIDAGKAVIYEHIAGLGLDLGNAGGDGSGLSRFNRLTAHELVEALRLAHGQPWWPTLLNGLSDAGTDGTLAARFGPDAQLDLTIGDTDDVAAASDDPLSNSAGLTVNVVHEVVKPNPVGNVRAKTGTLFDVVALTGILTTVDGAEVLFSFVINGDEADKALAVMDQIVVSYASATLGQLTSAG